MCVFILFFLAAVYLVAKRIGFGPFIFFVVVVVRCCVAVRALCKTRQLQESRRLITAQKPPQKPHTLTHKKNVAARKLCTSFPMCAAVDFFERHAARRLCACVSITRLKACFFGWFSFCYCKMKSVLTMLQHFVQHTTNRIKRGHC